VRRFDKAKDSLERLETLLRQLRVTPGWLDHGDTWQAAVAWAKGKYFFHQGQLVEEELAWKTCLSVMSKKLQKDAEDGNALFRFADCATGLIRNQIHTGKLAAAASLADQNRRAIEQAVDSLQRPMLRVRLAFAFGDLAVEQGRPEQARSIYLQALQVIEDVQAGDSSRWAADLRHNLATLEMLQGHWSEALAQFDAREAAVKRAGAMRGQVIPGSEEHAYALVRAGKAMQALDMMNARVAALRNLYDENSIHLWSGRAYLGLTLSAAGQREEALREMRVAVPKVLDMVKAERGSEESGVRRTARLNWLLDAYINLLADSAAAGDAASMDEAFRMTDLARGSSVQRALAASASRANIADPALAALARTEQDLQREISALSDGLGNLLSRGRIAEQDKVVADMRAALVDLRAQHAKAQAEMERRFPNYAGLLNPKPPGIAELQKLLKPGEALISIYAGSQRSLVWAIPPGGRPAFAVVPLNAEQIAQKVGVLRQALDPAAAAEQRLPAFPFDLAHQLFNRLLAPAQAGWKDARALIVVPHGALGQLPFGVLMTQPFQAAASPGGPMYASMADAPWLLRQVAISQLPSAVALSALRGQASPRRAERAFVGFGDPLFMADTTATGVKVLQRSLVKPVAQGKPDAHADVNLARRIDFSLLPALPDTAQEIEEVAAVLSADRQRDVFLGKRASEAQVKKVDLSPYRVVMFATHGLMSGEMPGLYQPALALSNPALSGDGEDGMLTMEEVLNLKLNADWVVLSACNTAAAGGQSSESVSGLGRAFFYAGAKALLVTNWAVETESARMLTTDTFRRQAAQPALSRAQALQQSSLALMQQRQGNDLGYAHPMFWAPYSLVGDGG
jgi:CHAT domain-containing protein